MGDDLADDDRADDDHANPVFDDDPLVAWALATFHTTLLVVILVAALHVFGPLGELLGGLSTVVGFALFLLLWASTWWTTRRTLSAVSSDETAAFGVVATGGAWGGVDGVCFLWAIVAVNLVPRVGLGDLAKVEADTVAFFAVAAVVASLLAFLVGAAVGALFAAIDALAFRAAAKLSPKSDP